MLEKELILETRNGREEFQIEISGGRFHVFKEITDISGGKQFKKIGEAADWQGVVALAKVFTGNPVQKVIEKDG